MRAARVLEMLLVLQRRRRSTAGELARLLEVSERTVLRDVEALSEAGIPIFARPGRGGGIELLDGFQTHLTGLRDEEVSCLLLAGQLRLAHRLGLAGPARAARHKLLKAVDGGGPPHRAVQAERLGAWFLHDPDPWSGHAVPHGELRRLAGCIQRQRTVDLVLADRQRPITVEPLGLVVKAGTWHLVVGGDPEPGVVGLDGLRATRIRRTTFVPPAEFDLARFWDAHVAGGKVAGESVAGERAASGAATG